MKSLLIVDDDMALTDTVQHIFEHAGYHVKVVYDGIEGWQQVHEDVPDIIVADINMPEMDGFEFLEHVRNYKPTETIPFIFMTARTEREFLRKGMELGADDFVPKPFSANEIIASVETALNKREKIDSIYEDTLSLLRKNITYALPHELRTPLQTISGYAYLIETDYQNMPPEDIKMMSQTIRQASKRLERLIENMLGYVQIEMISSDPQQQRQLRNNILPNAGEIIQECAEKVADRWGRIEDLHMQVEHGVLRMSAENLSRIIEELVDNAFKFSDSGKIVGVKTIANQKDFMIIIHDRGRGMSSQQLELIGAYMQFDRMLHEQQGSGLGLTIARRLVELHQGTLHIRSLPNDGTFITIKFPM